MYFKYFQKDNNDTTSIPLNSEETESFSANMCVSEISKQLIKSSSDVEKIEPSAPDPDPTFVTVIEVNGLKQANSSPVKTPPK